MVFVRKLNHINIFVHTVHAVDTAVTVTVKNFAMSCICFFMFHSFLGPLLLTWFKLNPNMDISTNTMWNVGWHYLSSFTHHIIMDVIIFHAAIKELCHWYSQYCDYWIPRGTRNRTPTAMISTYSPEIVHFQLQNDKQRFFYDKWPALIRHQCSQYIVDI